MKLVDVPNMSYFIPIGYKNVRGLFIKSCERLEIGVIECLKAPCFDKRHWLSPDLEVKIFDEELICNGT